MDKSTLASVAKSYNREVFREKAMRNVIIGSSLLAVYAETIGIWDTWRGPRIFWDRVLWTVCLSAFIIVQLMICFLVERYFTRQIANILHLRTLALQMRDATPE